MNLLQNFELAVIILYLVGLQ